MIVSIDPIGNADRTSAVERNVFRATVTGAVVGGACTAINPHYLDNGLPSDTFVKAVCNNLGKDMTSNQLKESYKIRRFVEHVVDPSFDLEAAKPLIMDSEELTAAIKKTPDEPLEDAMSRVFSQSDEGKVRQDLLNLQYKTKSNMMNGKMASMKLLNANFDAGEQKLVKNKETPVRLFEMLKKTAKKIQIKSVAIGAVVTGLVAGALCLIASDIPDEKK